MSLSILVNWLVRLQFHISFTFIDTYSDKQNNDVFNCPKACVWLDLAHPHESQGQPIPVLTNLDNQIYLVGTKICGFDEVIHWFRVGERPIIVTLFRFFFFSLFASVIVLKTIKYKSGKQFNLYFATMRNRREIQQLCEFVV